MSDQDPPCSAGDRRGGRASETHPSSNGTRGHPSMRGSKSPPSFFRMRHPDTPADADPTTAPTPVFQKKARDTRTPSTAPQELLFFLKRHQAVTFRHPPSTTSAPTK